MIAWSPTCGDVDVDVERSKFVNLLNRTEAGRVIRHLTGHSYHRRHEYLCGNCEHVECRLRGQGIETPEHLISQCVKLEHHRMEIFSGDDMDDPP